MTEPTIRSIKIEIPEQVRPGAVRFLVIESTWSDGETRSYKAGSAIKEWTRNEIVKHLDAIVQDVKDAQIDQSNPVR